MKKTITLFTAILCCGILSAQYTKEQNEQILEQLKLKEQRDQKIIQNANTAEILNVKPLSNDSIIAIVKKVDGKKDLSLLEFFIHNNFGGNECDQLEKYGLADTFYLSVKNNTYYKGMQSLSAREGYYYAKNRYDYAKSLYKRNKFQEALPEFEFAASYYRPDSSYYYAGKAGSYLLESGKTINKQSVLSNYNKAIELDAKNNLFIKGRGIFYFSSLKDTTSAFADFTKAIQLNPKDDISFQYLAIIQYFKLNYKEAIANISKSIDIDKSNAAYFFKRAIFCKTIKAYANAITDLNEAIFLELTNADYYIYRAQCNKALNNYTEAYDDYGFATLLNPKDEESKKELQKLDPYLKSEYEKMGFTTQNAFQFFMARAEKTAKLSEGFNLGPAVMNYYKCIQVEPKNPIPYHKAGLIFKGLKMNQYAAQFLRYAAFADGKNPDYFADLGHYYLDNELNYKAASGCYDTAALMGSVNAKMYTTSAAVKKVYLNKYNEALKDINTALTLEPNSKDAKMVRGLLYLENLKNYNAALSDFEALIKIDPTNADYIDALKACKEAMKK
jgi:tetratricopeptide (TPR) repeat protein